MIKLCPLQDCIQIPLDEVYNRILIYTYVDNPTHLRDPAKQQKRLEKLKEYNIPDEFPLYLYIELWEWQDDTYVKKEMKEIMLKKKTTEIVTEKYLRFTIRLGRVLKYTTMGDGGRWNRGWARDENF